ncbi:Na+/H+ antiporter NhaC family protein [Marinobacterium stanieri]|uniref:Putative methionine transporter, NhaC family n=1 Tax=Marinobacterium stanieri TaxID=49186 RepID=A0A1N6P7P2_9GAMM|nr:Na+/H+ antiporter NhaC family protein [Marinobacterium stanieri]SIQ00287.1 putative methionine transporter, NhaC family [Marinobacterium stanieri]
MTKNSPLALLPLGLFLALFIGSGLYYQAAEVEFAFYQISAPVAILPAIVLALMLQKGRLNERIETFISGVGDNTIITMVLIYLLAGAFASVAKAVGGVDATVNFGLSIIPPSMVLPGLFVITAFVATSMGTSMGTIAAIAPIAVGVAEATDLSLLLTIGTVIGGAMFGDNLSIISDTTIAATRTQGCEMRDKFRLNFKIALPAALLTLVWLFIQGSSAQVEAPGDYDLVRVLPYLAVLVLALSGLNVMLVLFVGILLAGGVGFFMQDAYTVAQWSKDIYAGYTGMQEILILSLLIGGLGALMKSQGGLVWLSGVIDKLSRQSDDPKKHRRSGEFGISTAVALTNVCTANNTVAILISGSLAKDIAQRYDVDPRRSASLMDIFSCVVQGMLPYGAQVLLAGSIAGLSPLVIVGNIHYCWALAAVAVLSIIIGKPAPKAAA